MFITFFILKLKFVFLLFSLSPNLTFATNTKESFINQNNSASLIRSHLNAPLEELIQITPPLLLDPNLRSSVYGLDILFDYYILPDRDIKFSLTDEIAESLFDYLTHPILQEPTHLHTRLNNEREKEVLLSKHPYDFFNIQKNVNLALNLLHKYEKENPNNGSFYLLKALLNFAKKAQTSLSFPYTQNPGENYFKLLANLIYQSENGIHFEFALEEFLNFKPENIYPIFNSSLITITSMDHQNGYSKFTYSLARVLEANEEYFSASIPGQKVYHLVNPFLRALEKQVEISSSTKMDLFREIIVISSIAASMIDLSEESLFYKKSLNQKVEKSMKAIEDLKSELDKKSILNEFAKKYEKPSPEEQLQKIYSKLNDFLDSNQESLRFEYQDVSYSFLKKKAVLNGETTNFLSIEYLKPSMMEHQPIYTTLPYFQNFQFVQNFLKYILNHKSNYSIMWERNYPILGLTDSFEFLPYRIKFALVKWNSNLCQTFFKD